ncbi:MAG: MauE/DoxX family redox-associated membrane protein [Myxococcota bacterium]
MDPVLTTLARLGLALLFVSAARHKWRDRVRFQGILADYRLLPDALVPAAALALPALEVALAVGLGLPATGAAAAVVALGVLLVYSLAIAVNLARGRRDIDCGCGGPGQTLHPWLLVRNGALGLVCLAAWLPAASRPLSAFDAATVGLGLAALALLWLTAAQLASTSEPGWRSRRLSR